MLIIGCDFHPSFQQIAGLEETGEVVERRLGHREEAEQFYRWRRGPVRVGMEAGGHYPWFERRLEELGHELWLGDAAAIRAKVVRQQKTDRGTRNLGWSCCGKIGFHGSGCRVWRSGRCGSCWCIGPSRCRCRRGRASRTRCRRWR